MPSVEFDQRSDSFIVYCPRKLSFIPSGASERKFYKRTLTKKSRWVIPVTRRNIEYMFQAFPRKWDYSKEAKQRLNDYNEGQKQQDQTPKDRFPPLFKFKTKPFDHQLKALNKAYPLDAYGFFFEQGLGKTFTAINLACAWHNKLIVVMCPNSIISVWEDEIPTHAPYQYPMFTLKGTQKQWQLDALQKLLEKGTPVWLLLGIEAFHQGRGYDDLVSIIDYAHVHKTKVTGIIDESSTIKHYDSNRTMKAIKIGMKCQKRMILSGTPVTQGYQDLFGQFQFLGQNILGFVSYVGFEKEFVVMGGGDYNPIVGYKNIQQLLGLISPYCTRVLKDDVLDLPPKMHQTRFITMSPQQQKLYNDAKKGYMEFEGREFFINMKLEEYIRLAQIVDGFLPYDKEHPELAKPIKGRNPKLEELIHVLGENRGHKAIVWCRYRPEQAIIHERLLAEGYEVILYNGDTEDKSIWRDFQASIDPVIFLSTIQSGCRGLNLWTAHLAITYSGSFSYEEHIQKEDRMHRIGQEHPCLYVSIQAEHSIDQVLQTAVEDKADLADYVSDQLRKGA